MDWHVSLSAMILDIEQGPLKEEIKNEIISRSFKARVEVEQQLLVLILRLLVCLRKKEPHLLHIRGFQL